MNVILATSLDVNVNLVSLLISHCVILYILRKQMPFFPRENFKVAIEEARGKRKFFSFKAYTQNIF